MKRKLLLMVLVLAGVAGCSGDGQEKATPEVAAVTGDESRVEACRAASKKLGAALKSALQGAMKEDGPLGAVNVCHDEAEFIAQQICDEEGLTVGRTSRRFRNPANAPDEWEMAGLESFSSRIAAGEKAADLEMWATVDGPDGDRTFRYLKAIGTGPMCLGCHGSDLAGDLEAKLAELYPGDKARGFATGELRGAFTVKMDLGGKASPGS